MEANFKIHANDVQDAEVRGNLSVWVAIPQEYFEEYAELLLRPYTQGRDAGTVFDVQIMDHKRETVLARAEFLLVHHAVSHRVVSDGYTDVRKAVPVIRIERVGDWWFRKNAGATEADPEKTIRDLTVKRGMSGFVIMEGAEPEWIEVGSAPTKKEAEHEAEKMRAA